MKKSLLMCLFALVAVVFGANAQTVSADLTSMDEIVAKLAKNLLKEPKATGEAAIDDYTNASKVAATNATVSAALLHQLYARQNGETVDGKGTPSLGEWTALAETLKAQTEATIQLTKKAGEAAKAVKDAPKMKAMSLGKAVKWANDMSSVTAEATTEEVKIVTAIIQALK